MTIPNVHIWPLFLCVLCTVRAVLNRELLHPPRLRSFVLHLEHMCILAMSHYLVHHYQYHLKLRFILRSASSFLFDFSSILAQMCFL